MSYLSDVLKLGTASTTSFIATMNGVATVNYTPTSPVLVTVNYANGGVTAGAVVLTVNGVAVAIGLSTQSTGAVTFAVGAGQATTITTPASVTAVVSAEKVN